MEPEEVDTITTGKAKSPGRVAWGKKIAALAKVHKEEKAAAQRQELPPQEEHAPAPKAGMSKTSLCSLLAVGSLVIGIAALYYQRRAALSVVDRCNSSQEAPEPLPTFKKPAPRIIEMQ